MGNTPVRNAARWTHSTKLSGPIRSRMLAEYSTMMCGMCSSSVRVSQCALDFPRRRLGHPNQCSLPPVFEAGRDGRHAHSSDGMPLRIPDRDPDARDFLEDVTLSEGILSDPRLLYLAPNARSTYSLERGEAVGVYLQNLLDLVIRKRSEQSEAPRANAERSPAPYFH